ncbi:anticodon-binding protein [Nocardiopsis sp. HNM0947]|uniref:Anticodon-binding protein n=1 Tax=Nocardiopsis coralli TaxID=2772213 RepID=A0ABR9PCF3_9ACTN|nr:DALR anticodon-binding domain-containing protein [Nocardiopsis coralli]MBE3001526.1 anticodon-binding protein [Nocardiopsis coralli]
MTPWSLEAEVRGAAVRAFDLDPQQVPFAWPRAEQAQEGHDAASPLAPRIVRLVGTSRAKDAPARVGGRLAEELRPGYAGVSGDRRGFVNVTFTAEQRTRMVRAAADGPRWLTGRTWTGEGVWPRTALHEAGPLAQARRHARADARARITLALDSDDPPPGPGQEHVGWRDPYRDGDETELLSEAARALGAVGEDSARVAFCRSVPERPRDSETTGNDLPVLPSADRPGAWSRLTDANPAFRLRYAHAHATSQERWTAQGSGPPAACPVHAASLRGRLFDGPSALDSAARREEPHILVRYLEGLASAYDDWRTCPRAAARAEGAAADPALPAAVAGVLRTGLFLLGVSAPTRL